MPLNYTIIFHAEDLLNMIQISVIYNIYFKKSFFCQILTFSNICLPESVREYGNSSIARADYDAPCFEQLKATHLRVSPKQQALLDVLLQLIKTWPLTIGPWFGAKRKK